MKIYASILMMVIALMMTSCDKGMEMTPESREARSSVLDVNWKLDQVCTTNASGAKEWVPAHQVIPLNFSFYFGSNGMFSTLESRPNSEYQTFRGTYNQIGTTFFAIDGNVERFTIQVTKSDPNCLEGTLKYPTRLGVTTYEVRFKR